MKVLRIVANIQAPDITLARRFYQDILGLDVIMDHGWITTFGAPRSMNVQLSIASEGGSGTEVPALSIEVDDLDASFRGDVGLRLSDRVRPGRRALGRQALLCARSLRQAGEYPRS
jgi:catechol 2,3-dioxygenase-like lactoylglutathione lyase family enzyme